jgi:hypothetical protein
MSAEQAEDFIIRWLRDSRVRKSQYPSYGYDVYLPNVMRDFLVQQGHDIRQADGQLQNVSSDFYAAGWELCRRGILRPGVRIYGEQNTPDGSAGNGYSITPFGSQWLKEADQDDFVPTEPGRFAEMLAPFQEHFGPQFYERAQEAVRCYGAHAYLACCTMCGAAAESILLATAIAKRDERTVLDAYNTARGRSRVENMVIGQAHEQLRREFLGFLALLKYWRDAASHGGSLRIGDNEALTSLAFLLRFAAFVRDHWDGLGTG